MEKTMSVSLESLVKLAPIPGIIVRDPVSGDPALAPIQAAGIVSVDGKSLEDHVASTDIHVPAATISANINTAVNTAIELLKNNGTGSDLPSEHDSLLKVSAALTDLTATLNRFLTGDADGGEIDLLTELVKAISDNKSDIAAIIADNLKKSDLVDSLESNATDKALTAKQGMALKGLIDALKVQVSETLAGLHSHTNQTEVLDKLTASGDQLRFAGKQVGETRTWVRTTTELPATWPTDMHPDGVLFLIPTA